MQNLIVAVIVSFAALYAAWRWMPNAWRRSVAAKLASGTHRAGLVDAAAADKLAASLGKSSGCGACDDCNGCAGNAKTPQA